MRASRFNIVVQVSTRDEVIVFNSLRGALTCWTTDEYRGVTKFLADRTPAASDDMEQQLLASLCENGYVISDDEDEMEVVRQRKHLGMADENRLDVIVMPNMFCNFRCPYCYEQHRPGSLMSDETESRIIHFLDHTVPGFKVLLLSWFGGEPLLNYPRILSITEAAKRACQRNGVALITHLTTNGYLLTEGVAKELIDCGIQNYQITIDGPPAIHDRTRVLRSGGGTFATIFQNIHDLVRADSRVRVSLRVNFNHTNLDSIPELLALFSPDVRPALRVVFEPIFGERCWSATANLTASAISSRTAAFYDLARTLGYDVVLGGLPVGQLIYCYAERKNQYIFNYNADIFKCSVGIFAAEDRFGFLTDDGSVIQDGTRLKQWFDMESIAEQCQTCPVLPLCMGGCRKARMESGATGTFCKLVPTNASYTLKSIAFGTFESELARLCGPPEMGNRSKPYASDPEAEERIRDTSDC